MYDEKFRDSNIRNLNLLSIVTETTDPEKLINLTDRIKPAISNSHPITISTPEEDSGDEDDQKSEGEELVIPKTVHQRPHAVEESLTMDHRQRDADTLVHE
jgi:hypothetical protein